MVLAVAVAVRAPLDVVVFGVIVFGTAHVAFELRYVIGRHVHLLPGRLFLAVSGVLAVIVAGRLLVGGPGWARVEVVLLGAVLLAAVWRCVAAPEWRTIGVALVAAWLVVALSWPAVWPVAQAHLHNLVPAVFLWEWSRQLARRHRRPLRALTVLWAVVVPVVLLAGVADAIAAGGSGVARSLAAQTNAAGSAAPAGLDAGWAQRLLVVFAFLQLVHYVVWCWYIPRVGAAERASFESMPVGSALRGRRFPLVILGVTAVVVLVAALDYARGRLVYSSFASYHAYLEFPILIALVAALGVERGVRARPDRLVPEELPA